MDTVLELKEYIDLNLKNTIDKREGIDTKMQEAMMYSVKNGGKRLRPVLLLATFIFLNDEKKLNLQCEDVLPFALALEYIHTYSLIHDDLPCMDDDDLRRGKPTSHKVFGEATALLAGDSLLNLAFEVMTEHIAKDKNVSLEAVKALSLMCNLSGASGMIKGQSLDMFSDSSNMDYERLKEIHWNKTGKLIYASMIVPAILCDIDNDKKAVVEDIAKSLGVLFQIQDDILDVTSTDEQLGKRVGSDEKNNKLTFVTMFGLEGAMKMRDTYASEITANIDKLGAKGTILDKIIIETLNRIN